MRVIPRPMASSEIERFIQVYCDLCREANEPILFRRSMTMNAVASFAANITIVDLHSDETWTACLNGTAHSDHANIDRTGRNVLETCSPEDRELRVALAKSMFGAPCALRAQLIETFDDGSKAVLESVAMPMFGSEGERKIVNFALLVDDIEEPLDERPILSAIHIAKHEFVDLGYGVPGWAGETAAAR